jgi:hypothetical protein
MSVPMNAHPQPQHGQHSQQQAPPAQYSSYPTSAHQGFVPQSSHPGEMQQMMAPAHPQPQMMNEQGHMMYQHYPQNMKVEH